MTTTCPNCTDTGPCDDCYQKVIDTQHQAWLDAQARADAWLDEQRNQAYAEAQWARSGTNYNDWYTGDRGR